MPTIRRAHADDSADLARLNAPLQNWHARAYPEVFKPAPDNMAGFFADVLGDCDCRIWLSCEGARSHGYLFARIDDRPETAFAHARRRLMIEHIAVSDDVQRRGHGAALIAAARDEARSEGCHEIALDTWADNTAAHGFFRAMGLTPRRLWFAQRL